MIVRPKDYNIVRFGSPDSDCIVCLMPQQKWTATKEKNKVTLAHGNVSIKTGMAEFKQFFVEVK